MVAALDLPAADRPSFVVQQSNGDEQLQQEVMSLLAAHARSETFLETPAAMPTLAAGATVGSYRILGILGEGGMGVVYLAEDTRLGRTVALKAIAPQFTHDERWRERLRREARAAATLVHPGIAIVYALEEISDDFGGQLFIASEHIHGETLRDAIATGPVPIGAALSIGRRLADALAAAHDHGVIHRDLKPENVMRTHDGGVKILDFGLAKRLKIESRRQDVLSAHTVDGAILGTPAYMSPEQLRGEPASAASDIFALGILLAEISSRRHPFGGVHAAATMAKILSAEPDLTGVPDALRPVILGCVTKAADERFHSAHDVREAIDDVARGGTPQFGERTAAFWWWQFHQAGACLFSATLLLGVWLSVKRLPEEQADYVLIGAVLGSASGTTLRLFNWFAARMRPGLSGAPAVAIGARVGDEVLALATFLAGFYQRASHPVAAAFLMSAAVVMTIISVVIEPATARSAKRH